jgi:hypothetical protein
VTSKYHGLRASWKRRGIAARIIIGQSRPASVWGSA